MPLIRHADAMFRDEANAGAVALAHIDSPGLDDFEDPVILKTLITKNVIPHGVSGAAGVSRVAAGENSLSGTNKYRPNGNPQDGTGMAVMSGLDLGSAARIAVVPRRERSSGALSD
jgi:hypothetical protein